MALLQVQLLEIILFIIPCNILRYALCPTCVGMKEQSFRIACAALECIAAAFPSRNTLPALLTTATPPPDAKPSSARTLPFSSPPPSAAHSIRPDAVWPRPTPKPAPPPKPRPSAAPSTARRNQFKARGMRLHVTGGMQCEPGGGAGEGAASGGWLEGSVVGEPQRSGLGEPPAGEPEEAPLRLEDLATRRPAAGPYCLPRAAESARTAREGGEQRAALARDAHGPQGLPPPMAPPPGRRPCRTKPHRPGPDWPVPDDAGTKDGAERAGAEGLRREKQRRIALLGLVSPRSDDDDALAAPAPHLPAHRAASPRAASRGAGGGVSGDGAGAYESPYRMLSAELDDTPRMLDGGTATALAPGEAQAQARGACALCGQAGGCGCLMGEGVEDDAGRQRRRHSCVEDDGLVWCGGRVEVAAGQVGLDAAGWRGRLDRAGHAHTTAHRHDQDAPDACSTARGRHGSYVEREASSQAEATAGPVSGLVLDSGTLLGAAPAPGEMAGRIACLHLGGGEAQDGGAVEGGSGAATVTPRASCRSLHATSEANHLLR